MSVQYNGLEPTLNPSNPNHCNPIKQIQTKESDSRGLPPLLNFSLGDAFAPAEIKKQLETKGET